MAANEVKGLVSVKGKDGNLYVILPITDMDNINGLQEALAEYAKKTETAASYAAKNHTHTIANISNLQTALDGTVSKSQKLTNEDLNTVIAEGFYFGNSGNTCANKPADVAHFGMHVIRSGESERYVAQHLCSTNNNKQYVRYLNGTTATSEWFSIANQTDNAASATKLQTARTINGVAFDGTANITLPAATTSANGLMPAADKAKLDQINYVFGVDATGPYIEDI